MYYMLFALKVSLAIQQYSIIIQQLFDSYNSMVSTGNTQELRQSVMTWFEQSCGLPALRPGEYILVMG